MLGLDDIKVCNVHDFEGSVNGNVSTENVYDVSEERIKTSGGHLDGEIAGDLVGIYSELQVEILKDRMSHTLEEVVREEDLNP